MQESKLREKCIGITKGKAQFWQGNNYGYGLGGVGISLMERWIVKGLLM